MLYTSLVVVGIAVAFFAFYADYSSKNLTTPATYQVLSNSAASAQNLTSSLSDITTGAGGLETTDNDFFSSTISVVKGTLALVKLPLSVADLLNSMMDDAFALVALPNGLYPLVKVGVSAMVALAILAYLGKWNP